MGRQRAAVLWGVLGVLAVLVAWELYKFLGPAEGFVVGAIDGETGSGVMLLPRTNDRAMPHIWDMVARLFQSASGGNTPALIFPVITAGLTTLGIAAAGWLIGVAVGALLGLVMQRWRLAEWGLLPWIVVSQTVPLIAFAPLIASIGSQVDRAGTIPWPQWLSVAVIASYLAFFPVAVGVLRGLEARPHPPRSHAHLRGRLLVDALPASAARRSAAPAAGAPARCRQRRGRRRRRRGLDRHARRHRPDAHPAGGPGLE